MADELPQGIDTVRTFIDGNGLGIEFKYDEEEINYAGQLGDNAKEWKFTET